MTPPTILICNDDGYFSEGIQQLKLALSPLGRVISVAPGQDCSGVSQKITLNTALRLREIVPDVYTVNGSPVDCVHLALHGVLKGRLPDLFVSGINHGVNLGEDTAYSGTVAAAYEAHVHGVPAFAVSTGKTASGGFRFESANKVAHDLAKAFFEGVAALGKAVWNINVPSLEPKGIRVVKLDKRSFKSSVIERVDPRGNPYYWIGPYFPDFNGEEETDYAVFQEGYVSMTPLKVEMTHYEMLEQYRQSGNPFDSLFP